VSQKITFELVRSGVNRVLPKRM